MSFQEIEKLSKVELKNKLAQMGMSLDRNDHPRDYYVQLYLEKTNSKNKITRDNTPFYKNKMLRGKRERERGKMIDKELIEDPNYEEEEYEEEEEYNVEDDADEDEDYIYEEEEEEINDNDEKERSKTKRKKRMKKKVEEKYNDYRESGIKITRLIRQKKKGILKNKKGLLENSNQKINVKRRIINNYAEMAGQNKEYNNNNNGIDINDKYTLNPNMNHGENYAYKNNEFHQYQNNNNVPDNKSGVINIQVENLSSYKDNNNDNKNLNNRQELRNEENESNQINYSFRASDDNQNSFKEISKKSNITFGAPKNDKEANYHLLSNGPISFGYNQNSTLSKLKDKDNNDDDYLERNSGNKSQNYNYFLTNLTNSVKDDIKQSEKSSYPKKVLLKWDTPKQKEFLYSSMSKEHSFRPSNENMNNMNNMEEVKLEYRFNVKPNLQANDRLYAKPPKNQNVSESIQNTTINQYDNKKIDNDGQNDYKSKLRSYSRNKGEQINNINNEKTFTNQGYNNLNDTKNNYSNAKDYDNINDGNNEIYNNKNNDINLNNYGKGSINININNDENLDKLDNNKNANNYSNINENNNISYNYRNNIPTNENNQMKGSGNINYSSNDLNHDHDNANNNLNMISQNNMNMNGSMYQNNNMINQNNMNMNGSMYQNNNMFNQNNKNSLNINENTNINNNEMAEDMIEYEENNNILNKSSNNQLKNNNNFNNMNINNNNNKMVEDMIEYEENNDILNKSSNNQLNNKDNFNNMIINNDNNNNINHNMYTNNAMNSNNNNIINENLMNNNNIGINRNYNNYYNSFGQNNNDNNINGENESQYSTLTRYTFGIGKYARNLKKNIMEKFKNKIYLWPIIIMIVFGIAYLLNEKYEHCERTSIILSFSIIMALVIIYNIYKYYKELKRYKKMAREDRSNLLERLRNEQINNENLANNYLLLDNFIDSRVLYHHVTMDEYANYVFPYLREYLKKDGFFLIKNNNENENNISTYWKEI